MNRFLASCVAVILCASLARAQDRFNVESFDPVTSSAGSLLSVYGARPLERGHYTLSLLGAYGRSPLSVETAGGAGLGDLVGSVGTLHLLGAYGVMDRLDVGIGISAHRMAAGSQFEEAPPALQSASLSSSKVAFGDLRIVPRASLYRHDGPSGFDLGALLATWLPTGGNSVYAGESFRVMPGLALDYTARNWMLAFNLGYMVRAAANVLGSTLDDQLQLGVGGSLDLDPRFSLLAELATHLNVLSDNFGSADVASEALAGVRYRSRAGFGAQLAGGPGIAGGINSPIYRLVASVGYEGTAIKPPAEIEETPELDADHDGIVDSADRCAHEPEDRDQFEDDDGCPDPDNDRDAVADTADRCPLQAEDRDDYEDQDGCPDADNDQDGLADASDACPNEPGVVEAKGCPAPPAAPAAVVVAAEKIELRETILFGNNNAQIQAESQPLIDEIAKLLDQHREIELVSIEGHSDNRGAAAHNRKLSEARAKSVLEGLTARGIEAGRLTAKGFGSSQPIAETDTDEGRAKNRRVELRIERRAAPP
jgi:outer membrane protein OmpA-like peptidoglycan-associated protein